MTNTERRGACIRLTEELLLEMLDFKGGHIVNIRLGDRIGEVDLYLLHHDLPVLSTGAMYETVQPIYTSTYGEDGGLIELERTDPPKTEATDD